MSKKEIKLLQTQHFAKCIKKLHANQKRELDAAIKAHVAGPTQDQIVKLNREQGLAKLKELGFTDDQISALLNG